MDEYVGDAPVSNTVPNRNSKLQEDTMSNGAPAGEQVTGTKDEHYDLVSVLYHSLQGATTCEQYRDDAQRAGDQEVAEFLGEARDANRQLAERAKQLLGIQKR
jgi:hypothetical protein